MGRQATQNIVQAVIGATGASVVAYLEEFNALPVGEKSGYDKYWNANGGFVNPKSPHSLTAQGVGKILAKALEVGYEIIANGGDEAKEMKEILKGIAEFQKTAPKHLEKVAASKRFEQAVATLGWDTPEGKIIVEQAKSQGINLVSPAEKKRLADEAAAQAATAAAPAATDNKTE
jgi:phage-related protein